MMPRAPVPEVNDTCRSLKAEEASSLLCEGRGSTCRTTLGVSTPKDGEPLYHSRG